ncbi:NosR/NirI family protein [Pseudohongiella sp. O18]|uniref:NosR/NirI family protein n=1 Tax=Pseudohongiella sp. O18 TaxID=2904248 RepID=UPI001F33D79A|nr:4Fe-4S binding protein [Pseudohongiella sp. O18]
MTLHILSPGSLLRPFLATCLIVISSLLNHTALAQTPFTTQVDEELLRQVFPAASSFSAKAGEPPVFTAYGTSQGSEPPPVLGYVFQTSDLPPEEIGFSAPIEVLVGLDNSATVTAIKVLDYHESFRSSRGDFMGGPVFHGQFRQKPLSDDFRVGRDIDGVSRATITSWATTRGVYNAARRVAAVYLPDSGVTAQADDAERVRTILEPLSWQDMLDTGLIRQLKHDYPDGTQLTLSMTYMGNEVLGEILVGLDAYSTAERAASARFDDGRLFLVGIAGNASDPFRQERLSITQGDTVYPMPRLRTVYAGSANAGKIAEMENGTFAVAMVLDPAMDFSQPFTVYYDPENGQPPASADVEILGVQRNLALGQEVPDPNAQLAADSGSDTNWVRVAGLIAILSLVTLTFWRKSAKLRWVTLSATLVYLGFVTGGFLSVSHITNTINLGPSMILSDTPLLIMVLFTLITTLIWGRIFCSTVCPFGALQDFITRLSPKRWQITVPAHIHDKAIYLKYAFLGLIVVMAIVQGSVSIFQYFEPFGTLFFYSTSLVLWAILIAILLASVVIKRFYCRYVCPLGAALGVLSLISLKRIKRVPQCTACKVCEHSCPTGAIRREAIDFKECVRCDVCEAKLIQRAGVCRHSVESLQLRGVIARG